MLSRVEVGIAKAAAKRSMTMRQWGSRTAASARISATAWAFARRDQLCAIGGAGETFDAESIAYTSDGEMLTCVWDETVSLLCHRPSRAASCSKYGGGGDSSLQSREAVAVCALVVRSACPKGLPHRAVVSSSVQPLQVKMLTVGFRMVLSRVSDASSSAGSRDGFRLPFKLVKTRPRSTVSALNPRRNSLRTSCEDAQGKLQGKCPSAESTRTWSMPNAAFVNAPSSEFSQAFLL